MDFSLCTQRDHLLQSKNEERLEEKLSQAVVLEFSLNILSSSASD